ncbi:hypothetical protein [Nocardia sp. NPDC046763]|uniref:hypothetical protein n=1 Tax=Nocardia sp. NPDC046763 TaxID=3155256 RepID=UPI0033F239C0
MPHFMVDDGAAFHAKFVAAGNAAVGLWVRAGAWSQQPQNLTEGFIPNRVALTLGTKAQIGKLVAVGLWHEAAEGYWFHEWADRQMSREEILERRRKRAESGRLGGIRSGQSRRDSREALASHDHEASASHPDPVDNEKPATSSDHSTAERKTGNPPSKQLPPAEMRSTSEASAQANPKQNRTPVPEPCTSTYVEGESVRTEDTSAAERTPPPIHHDEHPDGWEPDCGECTAILDNRIDFQAARVADTEPPAPHCPDHPGGTPAACGPCAAARRTREAYNAALARAKAAKRTADAHRAADDRRRAIADCAMCDEHGYQGTKVCDHDPGSADRAARGIAAAKAALAKRHAS